MTTQEKDRFRDLLEDNFRVHFAVTPGLEELDDELALEILGLDSRKDRHRLDILEIGTGRGSTSDQILTRNPSARLATVDASRSMVSLAKQKLRSWIESGNCTTYRKDALDFVRSCTSRFDVIASSMTFHNMTIDYREELFSYFPRILRPGGMVVIVDKIVSNPIENHRWTVQQIGLFFEQLPRDEDRELLKSWIVHHLEDEGPERVLTLRELKKILPSRKFSTLRVLHRRQKQALVSTRLVSKRRT